MNTETVIRFATAGTMASLAILTSSVAAHAVTADEPSMTIAACPEMGWRYDLSSHRTVHIPTGTDFMSGPGGQVTSSIEYGHEASTSVNISATYSVDAIVSSAEATFGLDLSSTASQSQSYSYTHDVPPGRYGHIQYGNWGSGMNVSKYYVDQNCGITNRTDGVVNAIPSANTWGFRYWES